MASVNKAIIVGNLGRDPEVRYSPDGAAICQISVATTSAWKDKNSGERRSETEWHRVVFYNRLAEVVGEYLRKGSSIFVEGRIKTRKWQNKDGQDVYTTEIIGENMQMLGGRDDDSGGRQTGERQPRAQQRQGPPPARQSAAPAQQGYDTGGMGGIEDDIPF